MSAFEDFIQVELPRRPWVVTDPAQETVPVRRGAGPRQLEFVSMNDGQVLGKVAGVVQGVDVTGLGGSVPKAFIHAQAIPIEGWFIIHNLDSEDFIVFVVDDSGDQVFPDAITIHDANIIEIDFNTAVTGKAVIIFAS